MITLTENAVNKVKVILQQRGETESGLRISVMGGGCSGFQYHMAFDKSARSDDRLIEYDGLKVFVDQKSLLYLMGTQVDYVEGLNGSGFKFNNPAARGTCGCGESFHV